MIPAIFPELTALIHECDATPGYRVRYDGEADRLSKYHADHREHRLAQMKARGTQPGARNILRKCGSTAGGRQNENPYDFTTFSGL